MGSLRSQLLVFAVLSSLVLTPALHGAAPLLTEFPLPSAASQPAGIITGPDGNLWIAESAAGKIARMTPAGAVTEFSLPDPASHPLLLAAGPDGNIWFTESFGNRIGRITLDGQVTEIPIPTSHASPFDIAAGPDGNLWFTEQVGVKVGRLSPTGSVTEFPVIGGSYPLGIVAGPDGNLWFAVSGIGAGRITPVGQINLFVVPTSNPDERTGPIGITTGADGSLWFADSDYNAIGRVTTQGKFTRFPLPNLVYPRAVASAGELGTWFAGLDGRRVGRMGLDGSSFDILLPGEDSGPWDLAVGPDGNLWITQPFANRVVRLNLDNDEVCIPTETILCIDDEPGDRRFKVELAYQTSQAGGLSGDAHAVALSPLGVSQGGLFWFVDSTNPEALVKILDGCAINQRFWVFLTAGTNLGFTVTVRDMKAGTTKEYTNPDLKPALPVQDTSAFACE